MELSVERRRSYTHYVRKRNELVDFQVRFLRFLLPKNMIITTLCILQAGIL